MVIISPVKINGLIVSDWIEYRGLSWSLRDVSGTNGGLTLAGYTQLDILATKVDLEITTIPLGYADATALLSVLSNSIVSVEYDDPQQGHVIKSMHPVAPSTAFLKEMTVPNGDFLAMWDRVSFRLEEL